MIRRLRYIPGHNDDDDKHGARSTAMSEQEPNRRKMIRIADYLTEPQIELAIQLWKADRRTFVDRVTKEIIEPNLPEINRKLGQENNARFLAYAVEYVFTQVHG